MYAIRSPHHPGIQALGRILEIDWSAELARHHPYLTSEHVQYLIEHGFTVGAHSIDHPLFCDLALGEQLRQIRESVDALVDRFGLPYRVFSFPYGEFGVAHELFDALFEKNLVECVFGTRGIIPDELGLRCVQRLGMESGGDDARTRLCAGLAEKLIRRIAHNDLVRRRDEG
jgi:peptidoglycan/xylan/chitin deacetylase (PgdA/CDA1 family)